MGWGEGSLCTLLSFLVEGLGSLGQLNYNLTEAGSRKSRLVSPTRLSRKKHLGRRRLSPPEALY